MIKSQFRNLPKDMNLTSLTPWKNLKFLTVFWDKESDKTGDIILNITTSTTNAVRARE